MPLPMNMGWLTVFLDYGLVRASVPRADRSGTMDARWCRRRRPRGV